ncbi:sigma-54-dependent transcriptional regulator [Oribacterium sp. FC2011]|uniref:sigma-54-dependent transcriptional regulator n=1 Tax=Oribacterium sp. FC2011 TaxID=1408311 RepID=UPI0004E13E61|nr:sigma-54-dependent transcriptional regulator [Oribacterium sp. FC2011]
MKYRILGVAPYEAMRKSMETLADTIDNIQLDAYTGNLEDGVNVVKEHSHDQYDVIISRGGTSRLISEITNTPVVEISLSVYDVLRAMRLADNYEAEYAIVGFKNITETAHTLCDLMKNRTKIVTIHDEEEVVSTLEQLKQQGISMVICDMVTQNIARRMDMNSILITSGNESILSAISQAINICRSYAAIREENHFLRGIMSHNGSSTIVMAEDGTVFLSTWTDEEEKNAEVIEMLRKEIKTVIESGDRKFFRSMDKLLYSVTTQTAVYNEKKYITFYFTASKIPLTTGKYGIRFMNREEAEEKYYNSFYSIAGAMGLLGNRIDEISSARYSVMIQAETGTGKDLIAYYIYMKSTMSDHPLITIDCSIMDDRGWEYLLNHYNSPFNDNENTIYFMNIGRIPEDKHRRLLSSILDTNLQRRNRLIFSASDNIENEAKERVSDYSRKLYCVRIGLPPLRQRREELPLLASLYLSRLNADMGKQIVGLEPGATEIIENYQWPQNYKQFQHVLMEAAAQTDTPYIRAETIMDLLEEEQASNVYASVFNNGTNQPLPNMTLEQINKSIIKHVLEDNKGNQSKTARQLGISRTTLWRYIGREK